MFRIEFTDKCDNILHVEWCGGLTNAYEKLNGDAKATLVLPLKTILPNGCEVWNPWLDKVPFESPFQFRVSVYYKDTNCSIFDGWYYGLGAELGGNIEVRLVGIYEYLKAKLVTIPTQYFGSGTIGDMLNTLWNQISSRHATNITIVGLDSITETASQEVLAGESMASFFDQIVDLGYEWTYRKGIIYVGDALGDRVTTPLVYNHQSKRNATICPNSEVQYDGRRTANMCVSYNKEGEYGFYSNNLGDCDEEIGVSKSYEDNHNERCETYVKKNEKGFRDFKVRLKTPPFRPCDIRPGDIVDVRVENCHPLFNENATIRVSQLYINQESRNNYAFEVQLYSDPEDLSALEDLNRRLRKLEEKTL